ncbi:filamentous hemagglutinin N-terminal domain-containing protein [Salmonella enterica]|nr:filamentous hemagglutinin N-terminal domain-containing protein [Salmonella enterica]
MNKIYKLKYDRRRNQLVVVSELTAGAGKETTGSVTGLAGLQGVSPFRRLLGTLTPLAVMTGLIIGMLPGLALANPDLPTGGQVVAGQGSISTSGNQMTIQQNTHGLVTNWNSFDIGKNHTVQFVQPDSSAVALNRVTGGHESQILGTLNANGQVMLVNPAGVMFGKGAKVNTAGLVASTKNIRTEDFMAGRYTFSGGSQPGAQVVNQGSLTTTKGGYIVLAADRVRNSGTLTTPSGKTVLAAAEKVTLQLDNTGLASVSVNGSVVNALVENSGLIAATNGQVYLTARGKEMLLNTVVNNSGTVEARGLNQQGGNIVLDGGDSGVVSQSGMLLADSDTGRGGKITVQGQNIHLAADSRTSATGQAAGGEVYVGGGWQGKDGRIKNASKVVTDRSSVVDVSATSKGDGGTAVLWSEDYTNFRGSILAQGGAESGKGGRVETSSRGTLLAAGDVQASKGGEWLLDPADIEIVSSGSSIGIYETGKGASAGGEEPDHTFSPIQDSSKVLASDIAKQLNNGTSVVVKTSGTRTPDDGSQGGNITVGADICVTGSNAVALTLDADKNITVNKNITSTNGKLNVNLLAARSGDGNITLSGGIASKGGDVVLGRDSDAAPHYLNVNVSKNINTKGNDGSSDAGNITLSANSERAGSPALFINGASLDGKNIVINGTTVSGGSGVKLTGSVIKATGDLSIAGNVTGGHAAYGVNVDGQNNQLTAANNLNITGNSVNGSDGALVISGGNFSAANISLKGKAGSNGGAGLGIKGNINVTKGNLTVIGESVSGAGVSSSGSYNVNVSEGGLLLSGCVTGKSGKATDLTGITLNVKDKADLRGEGEDTAGGALYLKSVNLNASSASLSGKASQGGRGFVLDGVTLLGGIENGANLSLSSAGSAAGVSNTLDTKLTYDNFLNLSNSGIENNTTISNLTSDNDLLKALGYEESKTTTDWTADFGDLEEKFKSSVDGKTGLWIVSGLDGVCASVAGNISLMGVGSLINGNLTAGNSLNLSGVTGKSLVLQNTSLNASMGGINLTTKAGLVINGGNLGAAQGSVNIKNSEDSSRSVFQVKGNITARDINITNSRGKVSLSKADGGQNISLNATEGGVTVSGDWQGGWDDIGVALAFVNITAGGNINISGTVNDYAGKVWGVVVDASSNLNAVSGIEITGKAVVKNTSGGGVSFAGKAVAGDISIKGEGDNNYGTFKAGGISILKGSELNATTGNLTLNGKGNLWSGVFVENGGKEHAVKLSAAKGMVNITGFTGFWNRGVKIADAVMNATAASINGDGWYSTGGGFELVGTILEGGISGGGNLSLASTGQSGASNLIDANITLDNLKKITSQGINNNTQVVFDASENLLKQDFGKKNDESWNFDASDYLVRNKDKPGGVNLVLRNACVTVSGDINVTGVSFEGGNLTGANLLLKGASGVSLGVTNTNLTATSGNVSLSGDAVKLSGSNDKGANSNTVNASEGSVIITADGNISGVALDVSNMNFKSKAGTVLNGTSTRNGAGVILDGVINVTGGGRLDVNGTSTRVNDAGNVYGLRTKNSKINVEGVMNLTGTVKGDANATANSQVVGLDLGGATLNATSANLQGVSTAKGFGVWMNTMLGENLKQDKALNLSSSGSGDGVINHIGKAVDKTVVKKLVDSHKEGLGSLTDIEDTSLFKQELETAAQNTTENDLVKDYGNWQLNISGVTLNKSGNISIKGASFINSSLAAGQNLMLAGAAGKILELTSTSLTSTSGDISLSGDAVSLSGTNTGGTNTNTLNASQGSVTVTANGNVAGNSLNVANTSFSSKTGTTLNGTATQDGNGVNLAGNNVVSGNLSVDAQSKGKGNGLVLSSNLDVTGKVNATGESAGGTGVTLKGNNNISTGGGHISGKSVSGAGVSGSDIVNITPKYGQPLTVSGESETGSGLVLSGTLTNTDTSDKPAEVMFSGRSQSGDGSVVTNLTLSGPLGVAGSSTTGHGAVLSGKIIGDTHEKSVITGTSEQGDGMVIADGTEATRVTLSGRATNGAGIRVKGALKSEGSVLDGQSTGTGTGVELAGPVSGGVVTGFSQQGTGVTVGEGSKLDNVDVTGKTADGVAVDFNGQPDITGGTTVKGEASGSGRVFTTERDDDRDDWSDIPSMTPDEQVPGGSHPATPGQDKDNSREESVFRVLQEHILQAEDSRTSLYRPDRVRDVLRPSGYRNQERPVSVDICTDGECRKLDVGLQDRPVR